MLLDNKVWDETKIFQKSPLRKCTPRQWRGGEVRGSGLLELSVGQSGAVGIMVDGKGNRGVEDGESLACKIVDCIYVAVMSLQASGPFCFTPEQLQHIQSTIQGLGLEFPHA